MSEKIKKILKKLLPSGVFRFVASYRYGFFGPYKNWQDAKNKSTGYDSQLILEKVKNALLKVKSGEAAYERDSVLFYQPEYAEPLSKILLSIAAENEMGLSLIDFGGSLGSTYWQNRALFKNLKELKWNIVEQPNFVANGRENFSDEHLKFYNSIPECLAKEKPTVIIFSSVIEYLEKPYDVLWEVLANDFKYVIFDRTTVTDQDDFITLQKVPPQVYNASYPCWFLNKQKLIDYMSKKYTLIDDFEALGGVIRQRAVKGEYRGLLFKLK